MKYQTTIVKSFFTVFILTFISSGLSAGTLGLDGDKEKKEELSATMSIAEICYECGFNNLSNFNRIFKKKKACSPKEFRENYRKKKKLV